LSIPRRLIAVAVLSSLVASTAIARASDELRASLKPVADNLLQLLKDQGQATVAVGDFTGPPRLKSSTGVGLTSTLVSLLNEAQPGVCKRKSAYGIRGVFDPVHTKEGRNGTMTAIRVTARLFDANGKPVPNGEFTADIRDSATIAGMTGLTLSFPKLASGVQRNRQVGLAIAAVMPDKKLKPLEDDPDLSKPVLSPSILVPGKPDKSSTKPDKPSTSELPILKPDPEPAKINPISDTKPDQIALNNTTIVTPESFTRLRPNAASPYSVEIVAASIDAAPKSAAEWRRLPARPLRAEDDFFFVDLKANEVYGVRIFNEGDLDAAVYLEIDGLNSFTFSDLRNASGQPLYSYSILEKGPAGNCRHFVGWHRTNEVSDSFLVMEYGKGVSALNLPTVAPGSTGMITIKFAPTWPEGMMPRGLRGDVRLETGRGPAVESKQEIVSSQVGPVMETISIRYSR